MQLYTIYSIREHWWYIRVSPGESADFTIKWVRIRWIAFHRFLWNYYTTNVLPYIAPPILTLPLKKPEEETNHKMKINSKICVWTWQETGYHWSCSPRKETKCMPNTLIIDSFSDEIPQRQRTFVSDWKGISSISPLIFTLLLSETPCPFDAKSGAAETCIFLTNKVYVSAGKNREKNRTPVTESNHPKKKKRTNKERNLYMSSTNCATCSFPTAFFFGHNLVTVAKKWDLAWNNCKQNPRAKTKIRKIKQDISMLHAQSQNNWKVGLHFRKPKIWNRWPFVFKYKPNKYIYNNN